MSDGATLPWYDSNWLVAREKARAIIATVKPAALSAFDGELSVFHTRKDFTAHVIDRVLDEVTMTHVLETVRALKPTELELHEARRFGRLIVHNHALFTKLQQDMVELVGDVVGEPVEPQYNFLSRYANLGVCEMHMDGPDAKWTLDLCLAQSGPWPIHFSQVVDWPDVFSEEWREPGWADRLKRSPSLTFSPVTLEPGQAVVFSGSSQWHYRNPIPAGTGRQFCDLLFFHFIPRGTSRLASPSNWAEYFGIPELGEVSLQIA